MTLRILWLSDRIIGRSAYSKVTYETCTRLAKLGHKVAHIPMGRANRMGKWSYKGVLIYPSGETPFAEDVAVQHYVDWKADILVSLKEPWTFQHVHRYALNFCPFAIIDHSPVSPSITARLHTAFKILVPSRFAQRELKQAGFEGNVHYIPHGVDTATYRPLEDHKEDCKRMFFFEPDEFVVGIVAMNRCFPKGTKIVTPFGWKPIEQIKEGDLVISGEGNIRRVTATFRREAHNEEFVTIYPLGMPPIKCTGNHEIYAVGKSPKEKSNRGLSLYELYRKEHPKKVKASDLKVGDYLVIPITKNYQEVFLKIKGNIGIRVDEKVARLIGYYLAEGFVGLTGHRDKRRTIWTFNVNEKKYINEVKELIKEIFDKGVSEYQVKNAHHIIMYGSELAEMFRRYFGRTSREKTIGPLICAKPAIQLEMFKTYFNGDGSLNLNNRNEIKVASYSKQLIEDMQTVLIRNGIYSTMLNQRERNTTKYTLNVNNREAKKVFPWIKIKKEKSSGIVFENYMLVRINDIQKTYESATVYDFEVEGDHNYISNNIKVSNSRKMIPHMLRGYKRFLELNPDVRSHLMLWTDVTPASADVYEGAVGLGVSDVGVNLLPEIMQLGLGEAVRWPDRNLIREGIPEWAGSDYKGGWDMVKLYNSFSVLLLCSGGEAFGLPLLEAQATGCPVVTTDYAAGPELVGAGLTVPARDYVIVNTPGVRRAIPDIDKMAEALTKILNADPAKLARKARAFAERYDWDVIMERYWKPFLEECERELYPLFVKEGLKSWA